MNTKIVKHEDLGSHYSVFIESPEFSAWIDIDKDGENPEWNQYIFNLENEKDVHAREMQRKLEVWVAFSEAAVEYLEAHNLINHE